jgi:hypothetical protein
VPNTSDIAWHLVALAVFMARTRVFRPLPRFLFDVTPWMPDELFDAVYDQTWPLRVAT